MKRTLAKEITSVGNRVVSDARELAQDLSKSISKLDFEGIIKDTRKSIRLAAKRGNRSLSKSVRSFKKTNTYNVLSNLPQYATELRKWSRVQLRKARKLSRVYAKQGRKLMRRTYPKVQAAFSNASSQIGTFARRQPLAVRRILGVQRPYYKVALANLRIG